MDEKSIMDMNLSELIDLYGESRKECIKSIEAYAAACNRANQKCLDARILMLPFIQMGKDEQTAMTLLMDKEYGKDALELWNGAARDMIVAEAVLRLNLNYLNMIVPFMDTARRE